MVSVVQENAVLKAPEADADMRPLGSRDLVMGLRQQLALADQLGLDLVAIRIAESLDQLAAELGISGRSSPSSKHH